MVRQVQVGKEGIQESGVSPPQADSSGSCLLDSVFIILLFFQFILPDFIIEGDAVYAEDFS